MSFPVIIPNADPKGNAEYATPVVIVDGVGSIVPSNSGSIIDTSNSSETPLTNGSAFTGEWFEAGAYDSVTLSVSTDQNGTYSVQFSPDGTNVDSTLTRYYRTNQINVPHRFTITRKYMRVVFTNDSGSDQTFLRLQTILGQKGDLNAPIDGTLAQDFDALSVRPTVFKNEAALGKRQGVKTWTKWGYNADVDAAASETVWSTGGNPTFLSAASTITLVSSSTNDDVGGTGATGVVVYGIDANRKSQIEVVFLDGTTPVVTANTYLGINRLSVYAAGSLQENDGTITATATTGGSTQGSIPAGEGSTQQAIFYTQDEWQTLVDSIDINCVKITGGGGSPTVTIRMWVLSFVSNTKYEVFRHTMDTAVENSFSFEYGQPLVVGENSVIYLTAESDINNTEVSARFTLHEFRDADATS